MDDVLEHTGNWHKTSNVPPCGHHIKKRYKRSGKGAEKATKILPALKRLPYSERLKACQIPTLHYRRIRGDMTEKIITGKYSGCVTPSLIKEEIYVTRGMISDSRSYGLDMTYANLAWKPLKVGHRPLMTDTGLMSFISIIERRSTQYHATGCFSSYHN